MSNLDEKKEYISTLRIYLGFVLAVVLSIGTGLMKLYLNSDTGLVFYIGAIVIIVSIVVFVKINSKLHQEIKSLKDL